MFGHEVIDWFLHPLFIWELLMGIHVAGAVDYGAAVG